MDSPGFRVMVPPAFTVTRAPSTLRVTSVSASCSSLVEFHTGSPGPRRRG